MELDGTSIFWLITLGMVVGGGLKLILGDKRGMGIAANLAGGVLSCLIVGALSIKLNVPGSLLLGLMGGMSVLFLSNIFYVGKDQHPEQVKEELN